MSSLTPQQRAARQSKVAALEQKYLEEGKDGGATHAGGSNTLVSVGAEGSLQPAPGFNAEEDAQVLRKAMKG